MGEGGAGKVGIAAALPTREAAVFVGLEVEGAWALGGPAGPQAYLGQLPGLHVRQRRSGNLACCTD